MNSFRTEPSWAFLMRALRLFAPIIPHRVYQHLWFHGVFNANVRGLRFKMCHEGAEVENQVFWCGTFSGERTAVDLFIKHLQEMACLIDVGANTGFFSLVAKAAKPDMTVIAIEPSSANYLPLVRNIALNGFDIVAIEAAATSESGTATLYDFPTLSYSASLESGFRDGTTPRQVAAVTLDEIADQHQLWGKRIALKIDVEGHEPAVLAGARRLISEGPTILIEILTDNSGAQVAALLPPSSFSYTYIDEEARQAHDASEAVAGSAPFRKGNYLIKPR